MGTTMVIGRKLRERWKKAFADQLPRHFDALSAFTVCEKAVIADADQSRRQHMQQEAAEELVDIQGEKLFGVAVRIVAIAEGDALAVEGDDPGVADGDAVGVVGEIRENLVRPAEGRFAVDDPVCGGGPCKEQVESNRVSQDSLREPEPSLTPCLSKKTNQETSKATREHPYGK